MDGAALPTFANAAVTKKKPSRSSQMSEQQFLFCQQMGVFVPPDQVPLGHQLGDKFWSDALAHPDVAIVRGKSFHVDWMLIVPKSVLSRVASWTALVEEALVPVHEQLSKWNENSLLNRLNKDKIVQNVPQLFEQTIVLCNELHRASGGRFDPSIAPVLEAWTLALDEGKASLSQAQKENLEACVGWEKVLHQYKLSQGAKIDLDGVSKGIGVDLIARKLKEVTGGCFFFDWGGEGASAGKHPTGRSWRLGVMKAPSLRDVFSSWQAGQVCEADVVACVVELPNESFWATSGDWAQTMRFGHFHICDPLSHSLLQCGSASPAAVIVLGSSSGVCDGIATAAMTFSTASEAHAWICSVQKQFSLPQFFVVSRSGVNSVLSHATPPTAPSFSAISSSVKSFSLLESALQQPEVEMHWGSSEKLLLPTVRVVSLVPLLVSALVPPSFNATWFSLKQSDKDLASCTVLHCQNGVVVASCGGAKLPGVDLRRALSTRAVASIRTERGNVLDACTSVAVFDRVISFNVEKNSVFGSLIKAERSLATICVGTVEFQRPVASVSVAGDHFLVILRE